MTLKLINDQKFKRLPKAIIFDTDNTLYSYAPANELALKSVFTKAEILLDINRNLFEEKFKEARIEIKKRISNQASSHSRLLYIQRTIELLGFKTQLLLTLDLEQTYWRTFLQSCNLFPNVRELLDKLNNLNIQTAIITDLNSQIQFRKIIFFGLEQYFDYVVTSEEAGSDKPSKAPFELALKKLDLLPNECWMIGDNLNADIIGGKNCGLTTLYKYESKDESKIYKIIPDASFNDYSKILNLIKKMKV
ncbi:Hypothetical protein P9515_14061 [Prochlorococcus marinus str. MIT 9515]|uniref:Uncharacterized protein n=1 Tax=Prochlorococcus marinus (strain MIT 9515) TaxID=167542 RepID=A2BXV2_PROM5|nr:HAD-IA family hydrolase [Prochlorococcus marinus]ABM72613.1 Hypothetical protein P9515_14061 [Prochlorococcus marinus str. MIT 9515]